MGFWRQCTLLSLLGWASGAFALSFRAASLPNEFDLPTRGSTLQTPPAVTETLSFIAPDFRMGAGGAGHISFGEAEFFAAEGMPQLPVVVRKYALPPGMEPIVSLSKVSVERSEPVPQISLGEAPYTWGPQPMQFVAPARGRYYPGKFFESKVVGSELWVSFYPVQYDRESKELVTIRGCDFALDFVTKRHVFYVPSEKGPESLIVTTKALAEGAEKLKLFHRDSLGVDAEVLLVESLAKEAPVAETELPDGYKDKENTEGILPYDAATGAGYHYDLSRRLIGYLWKQFAAGKKLRYVTILGDATIVPPSYYFSIRGAFGPNWGVTDACYGADGKCLAPKVAVGRLPYTTNSEVDNHLTKIRTWLQSGEEPGPELALYGGKAFRGYAYIGELGALRVLSDKTLNWNGVEKYFRTNGSFTKAQTMRLVSGPQRAKVVYYLDHGRGNEWYVEREFVSSAEVKAAKPARDRINPFLVTIACTNGAFDRALVDGSAFGPSSSGDESVGMALLKSQAGAVGFLGSARPALGNPLYQLDPSGNLVLTGSTYGLQLMDTFLRSYHTETEGRAGDLVLKALQKYVAGAGNNLSDESHLWTVLNQELLGDPVVPMLPRRKFSRGGPGARLGTVFPRPAPPTGFPYFNLAEDVSPVFPLNLDAGEGVKATLFKVDRARDQEKVIATKTFGPGIATWKYEPDAETASGVYLLKLENTKGVPVERQAWFGASQPVTPQF